MRGVCQPYRTKNGEKKLLDKYLIEVYDENTPVGYMEVME